MRKLSAIALPGLLFLSLMAVPAAAADLSGTWVRQASAAGIREIFRNTTMIPVITRDAPTTIIEVVVQMIRGGDGGQQH